MDRRVNPELSLHRYLVARHWKGAALKGPDPGIRFNYRIGRFVKNYLPAAAWNDDLYYLQAQGYWVIANWRLYGRTHDHAYRDIATRCAERIVTEQRTDGAWDYPNPEWRGRVATVEGIWGSLGLLETFRQTGDAIFLQHALRWHTFLVNSVGFLRMGDELSINYFAGAVGVRVPNNSTDALRFLAELADATGNPGYLQPCGGLLTFITRAQKTTGEFPYAVEGVGGHAPWPHFQCYQYNAFQCLGLMRYHELTGDPAPLPVIAGVLEFLRTGLAEDGHAFYQCGNQHRAVTYHAAAVGAAFAQAGQLGMKGYEDLSDRAFSYVRLMRQADGGCVYSRRDYGLLSDRRSYPRYLAMILYHLLLRHPTVDLREAVRHEETALEGRCAS
jgi:hypothetical protein